MYLDFSKKCYKSILVLNNVRLFSVFFWINVLKILILIVFLIFAVVVIFPVALVLINNYLDVSYLRDNIDIILEIQKYEFAFFSFLSAGFCIYELFSSVKNKKDNLHYLAGVFGVFLFFISLSAIAFSKVNLFIIPFISAGMLCAYCSSVPVFCWVKNRLTESKFEVWVLSFLFGGSIFYILNGYSSVIINEIFGVNERYFSFSKPVAMLLLLSPFMAIISLIIIIYTLWKKGLDSFVNFYSLSSLSFSFVVLVLSMSYGSRIVGTIELVAGRFDFDSISPCQFVKPTKGIIILDPAYTKALIKYEHEDRTVYSVRDCNF